MEKVTDLAKARQDKKKREYADLVLKAWDDADHADRRAFLDKKAAIENANRQKL